MSGEFNPGPNPILDILMAEESEPQWLVKDLPAPRNPWVCLAGEPGAGKSYVSPTPSPLALAAGCEALGGLVPAGEPKRIVYFDEENSSGDREKYLRRSFFGRSGRQGAGLGKSRRQLLARGFPFLGDLDWFDRAAEWVEFVEPHLIVVDTATPAFNIQDEQQRRGQSGH